VLFNADRFVGMPFPGGRSSVIGEVPSLGFRTPTRLRISTLLPLFSFQALYVYGRKYSVWFVFVFVKVCNMSCIYAGAARCCFFLAPRKIQYLSVAVKMLKGFLLSFPLFVVTLRGSFPKHERTERVDCCVYLSLCD